MGTSCLMIEKAPIVRQVSQIAKCAPLWAAHPISHKRQCRGAASSMGRSSQLADPANDRERPDTVEKPRCCSSGPSLIRVLLRIGEMLPMMGPRQKAQAALFYEFSIEDHVPADHLLRSV